VAFLGVVVMGLDGQSNNALDALLQPLKAMWGGDITTGQEPSILHLSQIFTGGDLLVVAAALAYTMHVLRLSSYVRKTTPLRLAGAKATVESLWSIALVFVLGSLKGSYSTGDSSSIPPSFIFNLSQEITSYFATVQIAFSSGLLTFDMWIPAVCACLWTGLVTCAYTIYAQSFGQRRVDATEANLIYSAQPLFSALFAWALLGEKLGSAGFLGGSLIALALWLVTTSTSASSTEETKKETK
jgi:drug/metabolite transporter (DMT)-like permease